LPTRLESDVLTRTGEKRVAISVAGDRLHEVIPSLEAEHVKIDHIYDSEPGAPGRAHRPTLRESPRVGSPESVC